MAFTVDQFMTRINNLFGEDLGAFADAMNLLKKAQAVQKAEARLSAAQDNRDTVIGNQNTVVANRQTQLANANTNLEEFVAGLVEPQE